MGKTQLTLATLGIALLAGFGGSTPAAARNYPWCAQGGEFDYPGECSYQSYQQCQASVSGRLLFCGPNPAFAYGQALPPQPRRRPRHPAPY